MLSLNYGLQDPNDNSSQVCGDENMLLDLQEASGLDTSPGIGLHSPTPGLCTEESSSLGMVIRRAAILLYLQFASTEVKTNVRTGVLQPEQTSGELLLPFNEALTNTLLTTWAKPGSCPPVNM